MKTRMILMLVYCRIDRSRDRRIQILHQRKNQGVDRRELLAADCIDHQGRKVSGLAAGTPGRRQLARREWRRAFVLKLPASCSRLSFDSGTDVEKDTVLVQLRANDDVAKLHALEAESRSSPKSTYQRDLKQLKAQAVSQATADNDAAALDAAKAQVGAAASHRRQENHQGSVLRPCRRTAGRYRPIS